MNSDSNILNDLKIGDLFKTIVDESHFPPEANRTERLLNFERYRPYFIALRDNDVEKVSAMLFKADELERDAMLNGRFDFGKDSFIPDVAASRLSQPLFIATCYASLETVELLLKEGADLFQLNVSRGNILHSLVAGSSFDDVLEERSVLVYKKLVSLLDESQLNKLLMHENNDGLRPIEQAVNLGTLVLYEAMQLTPGVYVTKTIEKGVFKEEWIDITEYETYDPGHRRAKSPPFMMSFLDKKVLSSPKDAAVVQSDFITSWMDKKMKSTWFIIAFWAFLRIVYAALFFIYITKGKKNKNLDLDLETTTRGSLMINVTTRAQQPKDCETEYMYFTASPTAGQIIVIYSILHSILCVITTILSRRQYNLDNVHVYRTKLTRKKDCILGHFFYVVNHMVTNILYVLAEVLVILDLAGTHTFVNILVILTCITSVWSVIYFIQVLPSIGYFAIVLQRMVYVLIQFSVVFVLILLPFPHAFYRLLQGQDGCGNQEFSPNFHAAFYNTFTVLLNMVDFTHFEPTLSSGDYVVLLFLHVFYVFLLPILLINFLIALLSASVAEVHEHRAVVMAIQKLCVITQTERHMQQFWFMRSLWKRIQSKHFHVVDGRYYLIRITLNLK